MRSTASRCRASLTPRSGRPTPSASSAPSALRRKTRQPSRTGTPRRSKEAAAMTPRAAAPRGSTAGAKRCCNPRSVKNQREAPLLHRLTCAGLAGLLLGSFCVAPAAAQDHPWLDQKLLAAAKAEGGEMVIYSSTNEG